MLGVRAARSIRAVVTIVTGAILWTSIATVTLAADKTFSATVAPGALVAGASYGEGARAANKITLTIVNESNQARLGSANVTPPAGIVATAATSSVGTAAIVSGVIQLRNLDLAPGANVSVAIPARVECGSNHAAYVWGFAVKQANDFKGTGNDLTKVGPATANTVTGNCAVVFSKQPKSAEKAPIAITNKIYDPDGAPVTVTITDGAGVDRVSWWTGDIELNIGDDLSGGPAEIGGEASGSTTIGVVEFDPTIDLASSNYSLTATATATNAASTGVITDPKESDNFNIVDDATICGASSSCSALSEGPKTKAQVDAAATGGTAGDLVILSINDPTLTLNCVGYDESPDVNVIAYDVTTLNGSTPANRAKIATFTLLAQYVTKSASKYEVCYASNKLFKDKSGAMVTKGLLPTCANRNPEFPCISAKFLDRDKNLKIVVSSPPGDPQARF